MSRFSAAEIVYPFFLHTVEPRCDEVLFGTMRVACALCRVSLCVGVGELTMESWGRRSCLVVGGFCCI